MRIVAYAWRLIAASALSRWNQTPPEVAARFEAEVIAVTHEIEALAPGLEGAATFHVAEVLFALELATGEGEATHGSLFPSPATD
ncbi:MAG: hypothetical protein ACYTFT_04135 [Planctomycetota bacterium]|jgi:hypothetical protein